MTKLLNTRILLSFAMILAAAAVVIGATFAFFSDTETSTANTFVAGDIDLQIDNTSYALDYNMPAVEDPTGAFLANPANSWTQTDLTVEKFFNFTDVKPGDYGEDTISLHPGSNDAYICAAAQITTDADNTITDPEDEVGGPVDQDGTADGDLDSGLNFVFWADDGDNVYEPLGDGAETIFLQGPLSGLGSQGQIALSDSQGGPFGTDGIAGGTTSYIGKYWCYGTPASSGLTQDGESDARSPLTGTGFTCDGSGVSNIGQTDSVIGDLEFFAVQSRNNSSFTCAQGYTPSWVEEN